MPYVKAAEYRRIMELVAKAESNQSSAPAAPASTGMAPHLIELRKDVKADITEIDSNQLIEAAMKCDPILRARHHGKQGLTTTDGELKCVSQEMMDRILRETKIDEVEWTETFDCNHIAAMFVTRLRQLGLNSAGRFFSWDGRHCFNVVIVMQDGEPVFRFIEAQTDQYVDDKMGTGNYQYANALIVLG